MNTLTHLFALVLGILYQIFCMEKTQREKVFLWG